MSNPKELNKKKQEFLRLNGISVKVDGSWRPWQEEQYKKLTTKDKHYQTTPLGYLSYLYDKAFGETTYQEDPDYVKGYSGELTEDTRSDARRWVDHQMQDNKTPLGYVTQTVAPAAATAAALVYGTPVVVNGVTKGAPLLYNGVRTAVTNPATIKPALQTGIQTGLGYLSTLPGTVAGNFIGDAAGSMALGMGLEEGQRAAFGRSAGDIVYSQLKPYIGDFGANMARPEYIISPSMVLKNTYTQATNNLGKQFERETARLLKPINKKDRLALRRNTLAVAYDPEYKKLVESPTTTYLDVTNHLNRQQDKFLNLQKAISGVEGALAKSQETSAKVKDIEELKVLARQYGDLQRKILSDEKILNQYNTKTAGAIVDGPKFRAEIEVPNNSPRFQLLVSVSIVNQQKYMSVNVFPQFQKNLFLQMLSYRKKLGD